MLRYDRQTKLGLVALYDIRRGNGAGPFLQPRSPHGVLGWRSCWGCPCRTSLRALYINTPGERGH